MSKQSYFSQTKWVKNIAVEEYLDREGGNNWKGKLDSYIIGTTPHVSIEDHVNDEMFCFQVVGR